MTAERPTLPGLQEFGNQSLVPQLPRAASVDRLRDQLLPFFDEGAADIISRAAADPTEFRRQLQNPPQVRLVGGSMIDAVFVDVFACAVAPSPTNPRESAMRPLPIQTAESTLPPAPVPGPRLENELTLRVRSREQFALAMDASQAYLLSHNNYMEDIKADGVLSRLFVVATKLEHADGSPDVWILTSPDGSSRAVSCHALLGLDTKDVPYLYSVDNRAMRSFIGDLAARAARGAPVDGLRAAVVPVIVPLRTQGCDIRQAAQSYAGMQHVSPPKPWSDVGTIEARAEAALVEMEEDGITERLADWFAGTIGSDEAANAGLSPLFDERSLLILRTFSDRRGAAARGIKRVDRDALRIRKGKHCEICADLALRPFRVELTASGRLKGLDLAREALQGVYQLVWDEDWQMTGRTVDELERAALSECADGRRGASGRELLLLGSLHLIRKKAIRAIYYHEQQAAKRAGHDGDRRAVHNVLAELLDTERGVRQLAQAVRDGRDGRDAIRLVMPDGTVPRDTTGHELAVDNDALRNDLTGGDRPLPPPLVTDPAADLLRAQMGFEHSVRRLGADLDQMGGIRPTEEDDPVIDAVGWPPALGRKVIDEIDAVKSRVFSWVMIGARHATEPVAAPAADSDDEDMEDGLDSYGDNVAGDEEEVE